MLCEWCLLCCRQALDGRFAGNTPQMQRELESFLPTLRTIHEQLLAVCSYLPTPVGTCVLAASCCH
jgi:hypothetical protein